MKGHPTGVLPRRRENEVQRAILDFLKLVPGVVAWRNNRGAMKGANKGKRWYVRFGGLPGTSDIIGWAPPNARFLGIEVKRPGESASLEQLDFLDRVGRAGGIGFVARSVEDVVKHFRSAGLRV